MNYSHMKKKFAKRVKYLRKAQSLTQENLAEKSTIHYKYIQRIEGQNPPNLKLESLSKLAHALNVEIKELFTFDD